MRYLFLLLPCFLGITQGFSQNVGIGTTTPINKLTVQTPTNTYGITHTNGTVQLSTYVAGHGMFGTATNHPLTFFANGFSHLTIATDGKVGIGTLSPLFKLQVQTTGSDYGLVQTNGAVSVGTYAGNSATANEGGWYGTRSDHPLYFFTGNGEPHVMIRQDGFVGIGTLAPLGALDVRRVPASLATAFFQGTTYGSAFNYSTTEDTYIRGGKAGSHVILNDAAALGKIGIGTANPFDKLTVQTGANSYGISHTDGTITTSSYVGSGAGWFGTRTNHPLHFFTGSGGPQLSVLTNGRVVVGSEGIELTDPFFAEWRITANGLACNFLLGDILKSYIASDGSYVQPSDLKLKKNVRPYKPVLSGILNLVVSTYEYKTDNTKSFGLIAQNVASYFPELVSESKDNKGQKLLGLDYSKTGVLAIKAIQEQQEIIETLQNKIEQLEKKYAELEKIVRQKP